MIYLLLAIIQFGKKFVYHKDSLLRKLIKYSFLLCFGLLSSSFSMQQTFDPVAKGKAIFIYNFTRYFEWPEAMKSGNFVIQIVGSNSNINSELSKMAAAKQVGNQKIELKITNAVDASIKPHIIYILSESSDQLKEASAKYKGKGALIVTEKPGLAKVGAAINFVAIDNKQKFEYSKSNASKAGLKTSDELKNLAIVVD